MVDSFLEGHLRSKHWLKRWSDTRVRSRHVREFSPDANCNREICRRTEHCDVLGGADRFGHLRLERRLDQCFDYGTHEILTQREQSFEVDNFLLYPQPWSSCVTFTGR